MGVRRKLESITWRAHYKDGSILYQAQDGMVYTYNDIDRDRLEAFGLYVGDVPVVLVDLNDEGDQDVGPKRLIYRIRNRQNSKGGHERVYMVGWQRKVKDRNVQAICYLNDQGTVVLGGQWQNDRPFMGSIQPFTCESDLK